MLALASLEVGPGDEVIVPSMTFVSTAHAVALLGASPVFCDVEDDTLMINWEDASDHLTAKTKAVIAVNYAGQPIGGPNELNGLPVVWDFAHAGGMRPVHPFAYLGCWSFHAVKNISCGDGGMVTTNDTGIAALIRKLRWMGINKSTWSRVERSAGLAAGRKYSWQYDCSEIGFKAHMNDITASIGRVQLSKLKEMQCRRYEVANYYNETLCKLVDRPRFDMQHNYAREHGWHLYVIRVLVNERNALVDHLKRKGIQSGVHYQPVHKFNCYRVSQTLPVVEEEWQRLISLPMHACLTDAELERVVQSVNGFYE